MSSLRHTKGNLDTGLDGSLNKVPYSSTLLVNFFHFRGIIPFSFPYLRPFPVRTLPGPFFLSLLNNKNICANMVPEAKLSGILSLWDYNPRSEAEWDYYP